MESPLNSMVWSPSTLLEMSPKTLLEMPLETLLEMPLERLDGQQVSGENLAPEESLTIPNGEFESSIEPVDKQTKDVIVVPVESIQDGVKHGCENMASQKHGKSIHDTVKYSCNFHVLGTYFMIVFGQFFIVP